MPFPREGIGPEARAYWNVPGILKRPVRLECNREGKRRPDRQRVGRVLEAIYVL